MADITELVFSGNWDEVLNSVTADKTQLKEIDFDWLQRCLIYDTLDKVDTTQTKSLKKLIEFCLQNGLTVDNISNATFFEDFDRIKFLPSQGHDIDETTAKEYSGLFFACT